MLAVPAFMPTTSPVAAPTDAMLGALLLHVPPGVLFASVMLRPLHTVLGPEFALSDAFTVTTAVRLQPVGSV